MSSGTITVGYPLVPRGVTVVMKVYDPDQCAEVADVIKTLQQSELTLGQRFINFIRGLFNHG